MSRNSKSKSFKNKSFIEINCEQNEILLIEQIIKTLSNSTRNAIFRDARK